MRVKRKWMEGKKMTKNRGKETKKKGGKRRRGEEMTQKKRKKETK